MKKILLVGASGTIGKAVYEELKSDNEIITASMNKGDIKVDLQDSQSVEAMYQQAGKVDALICTAARGVILKPLSQMTREDYIASMQQKCLGQIDLALLGAKHLADNGSITLTTGIMNHDFVKDGTAAAVINAAVNAFAQAAALDMPRGIRINVVSPALLEESVEKYAEYCPGFEPVSSQKVARAFRKSVYGIQTGRIYHVS